MSVVELDLPVLLGVVIVLVITAWRYGLASYVLAGNVASTFSAVFSYGLTLSVGRLIPIALAPAGLVRGDADLRPYVPFTIYAALVTLISAWGWRIPEGVGFFYGEGRFAVQLFNLLMLAMATRATALALQRDMAAETLWRYLTLGVFIHGLASVYQLIAGSVGLPVIGISRPFGLTASEFGADVAAVTTPWGDRLLRPGGLAGEPKTAAVIYGIYVAAFMFGGWSIRARYLKVDLRYPALALAVLGFVSAISTSAIIGLALAIVACIVVLGVPKSLSLWVTIAIATVVGIVAWQLLAGLGSVGEIGDLLQARTFERLEAPLDLPIEATLAALRVDPLLALWGAGLGGSSFIAMEYMGEVFEYAFAPNVGGILLIAEVGILGLSLLIVPLVVCYARTQRSGHGRRDAGCTALAATSIAALCLCLTGSGIAMGIPLAIAAASGVSARLRRSR